MKIQRSHQATLVVALASAFALSACGKKEEPAPPAPPPASTPAPAPAPSTPPPAATPAAEPVTVTSVDLGNDEKVSAPTTSFAPKDTIYAAVKTTGSAPMATLAAKWSYQDGQTVSESSQPLAPNGASVTTFHISKADGWPAGNYKVEITLDGKPAATKEFSVK